MKIKKQNKISVLTHVFLEIPEKRGIWTKNG